MASSQRAGRGARKGIDIAPKYIPAEVFDKRAVEKNQVVFHDVAAIEVKPHVKKNSVAVELTDFSVFYSQDSIAAAEASLKEKSSKIVAEKGQIVKVSRTKTASLPRERLTKKWTDWIDYWAVDFNFENKREIIRVQKFAARTSSIAGLSPRRCASMNTRKSGRAITSSRTSGSPFAPRKTVRWN